MRQVGPLCVWAEPDKHRLMLGNRAAWEEAQADQRSAKVADVIRDVPPLRVSGTFETLGTYRLGQGPVVRLDLSTPRPWPALQELLVPLASDVGKHQCLLQYQAGAEGQHTLWRNGICAAQGNANGFNLVFELLLDLLADQPLLAILHGSAVLWRGKRIVFMGVSGSGKSTLAAVLAGEGAYVGDDYVAVLDNGSLLPLPLAPSIKEGAWSIVGKFFPKLAGAPAHYKGDNRYKLLPDAPFTSDIGPADLLVFPRFDLAGRAKAVRLTEVETCFQLADAGLWLPVEKLDPFMDVLEALPSIALRHTPDMTETRALLSEALSGLVGTSASAC